MNRILQKAILFLGFYTIPFSTSRATSFILNYGVIIFLVSGLFGMLFLQNKRFPKIMFLSFLISLFGIFFSFFSEDLLASVSRSFVQIIAISSCFYFYIYFPKDIRTIEKAVVGSGLILCVYYIGHVILVAKNYGIGIVLLDRTTEGLASLPWGASNVISACVLLTYIVFINSQIYSKRNLVSMHVLFFLGILFTFSRTGLALYIIVFLCNILDKGAIKIKVVFTLSILILFFCVGYAVIMSGDEAESLNLLVDDRTSIESVSSGNGRIDHWVSSIQYFFRNPLNPVGYYGSLSVFGGSSHNWMITTLLEQSIIVFLMNILLMILLICKAFKISNLFGASALIVFLNLFIEDVQFVHPYMFYFSFFILIVCSKKNCPSQILQVKV